MPSGDPVRCLSWLTFMRELQVTDDAQAWSKLVDRLTDSIKAERLSPSKLSYLTRAGCGFDFLSRCSSVAVAAFWAAVMLWSDRALLVHIFAHSLSSRISPSSALWEQPSFVEMVVSSALVREFNDLTTLSNQPRLRAEVARLIDELRVATITRM